MEYLSRLFKRASTQSGFEYHPHYKKLGMTHLMFADGLVIFCKASPASLKILMEAFQQFTDCTGLQANMSKSQIVFGGASTSIRAECMALTGFTEEQLPFTYLGLPITASKLSKVDCKTLMEKITTRITTWANTSLIHADYCGWTLFCLAFSTFGLKCACFLKLWLTRSHSHAGTFFGGQRVSTEKPLMWLGILWANPKRRGVWVSRT